MNTKAHDKLMAARVALLLDHYFFGRLAMHLKFVEEERTSTLAVDGKHIFYNPDFILGLSADLTKSAVVHEIMHCVCEHFLRRNGRDRRDWNRAGDYVINLVLQDAGFRIGDKWLLDAAFKDMTTEHVYDIIHDKNHDKDKDQEAMDEVRDGAVSQGDAVQQSMEWKIAVTQAAQMAKEHGKLPGSLQRFLGEIEEPQVPWREVLQRFVTEVSKNDYSWARPNRKFCLLYTSPSPRD